MKVNRAFLPLIATTLCMFSASNGFGSFGGSTGAGLTGTLYANFSDTPANFELVFQNFEKAGAGCSATLTWSDANGKTHSAAAAGGFSTTLSSSLPSNGAIAWTSTCTGNFYWQIERAPAQGVSSLSLPALYGLTCGTSQTLYRNLRSEAVDLDLALTDEYESGCGITLTWTDASGQARTVSLGENSSQGISTSVPANASIIATAGSGTGNALLSWQLERIVPDKLW